MEENNTNLGGIAPVAVNRHKKTRKIKGKLITS
jgi:hypothetical protein